MANSPNNLNMNPEVPPIVRNYNNMDEYGRVGQYKYSGVFFEEFERNLLGRRGIEVFKEMSENDDIIGAILFAIEMLIRQADFKIEPQGKTAKDKAAADFVEACINDMQQSWQDTLSEILSFLPYGWSYHEICYKRRLGKNKNPALNSKFDDGMIGWAKLPIRSQDTLWRWEYDENDNLAGMTQMPPPDYQIRTIPIGKALHFVTKSKKWNPEGRSILRNAYRSYFFKKRFQEIEGIGVERDLAGLPIMTPPAETDIWDTTDEEAQKALAWAEKIVRNVRRDATEGIVKPYGWTFELLSSGSKRQFEIGTIIERYDSRMAMTVLADFVLMGHENVGSFALSDNKTELFSVAIGTYMDIICEAFNKQAIPRLIDLNGDKFSGITDYPKMVHGDLDQPDITKVSQYLKDLIGIGLIVPDENLQDYTRRVAGLPEPIEGAPLPGSPEAMQLQAAAQGKLMQESQNPNQQQPNNAQKPPQQPTGGANSKKVKKPAVNDDDEMDDEQDKKRANVAKERLGRNGG